MTKEQEFAERESKIPLLLDYLNGELNEEDTLEIRNELRRNEDLRRDMYFLIEARSQKIAREDCPSIDLLTSYHFDTVEFGDQIKQYIQDHIETCEPCQEEIERLEKFDQATAKARSNLVEEIRPVNSLSEFLKEIGREYLEEEVVDSLIDRLGELLEKSPGMKLDPVALGFSKEHSLTKEEQEYLQIIQDLFPAQEKLDTLLKQGKKEEFKQKLHELLEDREIAEDIIEKIS